MVMGANEDEEGETVHRVVGTSFAMLKDDLAEDVFKTLSLAPEDVPIPMEAVQLIWTACLPERAVPALARRQPRACRLPR